MAKKRRDKKPVIVNDESQFIDGLINDMLSGQGLEPITDELIDIFVARGMDPDELRKM